VARTPAAVWQSSARKAKIDEVVTASMAALAGLVIMRSAA
jgi:hypothetical protein